jgi:two-component system sensor histidine kinase KdpD
MKERANPVSTLPRRASHFEGLFHLIQGRSPRQAGDLWRDLLFACAAVIVATLLATPLFLLISLPSLMLPYVLAVVVIGLHSGSRPALFAAFLGLSAHNFFFTTPYFGFGLPHEDDIYSLAFLSLIALICGPVASHIRNQFIELHDSNRHLEALRLLSQQLAVAEDAGAIWAAAANELRRALQTECWLLFQLDGRTCHAPVSSDVPASALQLVEHCFVHCLPAGRLMTQDPEEPWTVFPVQLDGQVLAVCLLQFDPELEQMPAFELDLIEAILHQTAATIGRIQLSRELEHARVQAEVEQLRSAMLSSVSHDLKSPLAAIMGAAESVSLLDRQLSPEDRGELMHMIWSESHRLDTYIQNLLDMTRLENGALRIERDWVSVDDLAGSAMSRLKRYFPGVRLEYNSVEEPPLLYVNPALLEQALFNILENAVKYSPPEETIVVRVDNDADSCRIAVEDRGPGIPEQLLEKIFDMFYVIGEGDHRKHGTGVGLAICRGMITAQNGRIRAEQRPGGGSRFVMELPLVYPESTAQGFSEDEQ